MSAPKDGGQAFPAEQGQTPDGTWNQTFEYGMSVRDYFAAQVLQPLIWQDSDMHMSREDAAKEAYAYADAMIAEREKEPTA